MLRLCAAASILAVLLAIASACGGDDDVTIITPVPDAPSPSATGVTAGATPDPTEFRVVVMNLMSPLSLDPTNTTASDTFDQRLNLVIAELKQFKPDLIALNEVTETGRGKVAERLVSELKMETAYVRAKPW